MLNILPVNELNISHLYLKQNAEKYMAKQMAGKTLGVYKEVLGE